MAMGTLLKMQNPIGWSHSQWWPGGRVTARPLWTCARRTSAFGGEHFLLPSREPQSVYAHGCLCMCTYECVYICGSSSACVKDLITALINDTHTLACMYICIHTYVYVCTLFPPNTYMVHTHWYVCNASESPAFISRLKTFSLVSVHSCGRWSVTPTDLSCYNSFRQFNHTTSRECGRREGPLYTHTYIHACRIINMLQ